MKWVALINDKSVNKVSKAHEAGMISFRLSIHDQTRFGDVDWDFVPAWTNILPNEPYKYPIRCNIYQCKELPASDDNGTSDPYIKIWSPFKPDDKEKKKIKTVTVHDNNNPIFYQTIESYFYSVDLDWAPPVILEIYDEDSGTFDTDDFIGRAVIDLLDAAVSNDQSIPRPKWHPVKLGFRDNEPVMGQILVSFSILNPNSQFSQSLNQIKLRPDCEEYEITINVLGLRNLESPGMLPVTKPFINFALRSLLPPSRAHAIENINTQPSATGPNPTISTVIRFSIFLPSDPLYCPSLTCGVYDYVFKGMSQPIIGNFVVPIGELQHLQDDFYELADERTKKLIQSLDEKIDDVEKNKGKLEERKQNAEAVLEQQNYLQKVKFEEEEERKREELALKSARLGNNSSEIVDPGDIELGVRNIDKDASNQMSPRGNKKSNALNLVTLKKELDEDEEVKKQKDMLVNLMNEKEEKKAKLKQKRKNITDKMMMSMQFVGENVIYPTYHLDERLKIYREDVPPPKDAFIAIGYDPKPDSRQKHYRRFYEDELENIKEVIPKAPFQSFDVLRGQSRGLSKGWFTNKQTDEAGQVTNVKKVGQFKGIVSIVNKEREDGFKVVKETRINILKESLNTLSQRMFETDFEFDYNTIGTAEGREIFRSKLQQLGCDQLKVDKHFYQMNYQEELARLMMIRTK